MNAPLSPRRSDGRMCAEVLLLTEHLGQPPALAQLAEWTGRANGTVHYVVDAMVAVRLVEKSPARRYGTGRVVSVQVTLTEAGRELAAQHPGGFPGAPRALSRPVKAKEPEVGDSRGTRFITAIVLEDIVVRCRRCGHESVLARSTWIRFGDQDCRCVRRGTSATGETLTAWLADVTKEGAHDLELEVESGRVACEAEGISAAERLAAVLMEINASPFTELERCNLAIAYIDEHHDGMQMSLEQVALVMGVTRERIRQIQDLALKRMRAVITRAGTATDTIEALRELDGSRRGED